ncbi:hypothetical protein RJ639_024375 [Escallonia herrerae]|uniref:Uncharacterized protein n=1 Tax=Escallonia herrerae TaxID=1293975 RepID=A0AA88UYM1_9ASTE|nr:hypothetical protein RJ639_024375 [Escallonia herrerae]
MESLTSFATQTKNENLAPFSCTASSFIIVVYSICFSKTSLAYKTKDVAYGTVKRDIGPVQCENVSRQDPLLKLNHANVMEVPGS